MSERLALVADEYARALGRDNDEINAQRELSLQYYKGQMDDLAALPGRSKVTSSDIADAVETVVPDLIEIFMGEEVAVFSPQGEEDEDAATQETDFVNHVFYNENPGFLTLYSAIKDACIVKTGIMKVWGEDYEEPEEEFTGKTADETAAAAQKYPDRFQITKINEMVEEPDPAGQPDELEGVTFDFVLKGAKRWRAKVAAVPPEDFGVSKDTVALKDSPYCFHRTRLRAYELVKRGISQDLVDSLPAYGQVDNGVAQARSLTQDQVDDKGGPGEQRLVEVVEHYLNGPDGRWCVLTDASSNTFLEESKVERVPFAALTPYLIPHQFFGESVADKLIQIQRIMTALQRMMLDSGFFALNQRMTVNMSKANEWTIADLLNNAPNVPVRTNGENAVLPLSSGGLPFDTVGSLEFFATKAESRTGIVRNAQGLNPDTLHDTAKGAMALLSAAQKRVRMIARIFAETGVKDVFLLLHHLLRQNATGPMKAKLRGEWAETDPSAWGSRQDMTIDVGIGAGGKEAQTLALQQGLQLQETIIMGGGAGTLVTPENVYALAKKFMERGLGFKSADPYLSDPADAPPQAPKPDPAMAEVEGKLALQKAKDQGAFALDQEKAQASLDEQAARAEQEFDFKIRQMEADAALKREMHAADMQFRREQAAAELELKREEMQLEFELKREANQIAAQAASSSIDGPQQGGQPG